MIDVDDLFSVFRGIPHLVGARCRGRHDIFDPRDPSDPDRGDIEAEALALCRSCPALAGCTAWFESLQPAHKPNGVIAGQVNRPREKRAA